MLRARRLSPFTGKLSFDLDDAFTLLDSRSRDNAGSVRDRISGVLQNGAHGWLAFDNPARVVSAYSPDSVRAALAEVERLTRDFGWHALGFVAYEAGAAFGLRVHSPRENDPLVWFALFEPAHVVSVDRLTAAGDYILGPLEPSLDRRTFGAAFNRIKAALSAGDTYQVNFTFKMRGSFAGDATALFVDLVRAQQPGHAACLHVGDRSICSASPELFFSIDGAKVAARPMKGTAARGRTWAEDVRQRDALQQSAKQRAENVMIVDMVRNDLGRIADIGTVDVPELFAAERYPAMWQMTSLVVGRSTASLEDVFAAMHPSASVTGAPKVSTMAILTELETEPRGVYTGAIGHVSPDGTTSFNVAIRTAVVDRRVGTIEFGIGSGVVWDSDAAAEYDECLLKGSVLGRRTPPFELLETMRWTEDKGFFLLERHLERLRQSAEYFAFPYHRDEIVAALEAAVSGGGGQRRIRLIVDETGCPRVEHTPLLEARVPVVVALASEPVDGSDRFLFHKTTNRTVYDRALMDRVDDVILWNREGQATEATRANLVIEADGLRITPPVDCGLLAGTYRAELLGAGDIVEQVVSVDRLRAATSLWLINSVYEWRAAVLRS